MYHPTQILADLLTIYETYNPEPLLEQLGSDERHLEMVQPAFQRMVAQKIDPLECFKGKKIAWVGDTNNIINEIMVTMPRLGMQVAVASPKGYDKVDERVWKRV